MEPDERVLGPQDEPTPIPADPQDIVKPRVRRTHLSLFVRDPAASATWYEDV